MAQGSVKRGGYGGRDPIGGSQGGGYAGSSFGHGAGYGAQGYGASHGGQGGGDSGEALAEGGAQTHVQQRRRGPKGYQRSDARIREDICERLMQHEWVDAGEVTVTVDGGVVKLEGSVPERQMKHAIEDVAAECSGVQDVQNQVKVASPS